MFAGLLKKFKSYSVRQIHYITKLMAMLVMDKKVFEPTVQFIETVMKHFPLWRVLKAQMHTSGFSQFSLTININSVLYIAKVRHTFKKYIHIHIQYDIISHIYCTW